MKELIDIAIKASIEAGKEILKIYETDDFNVKIKSDNSPLTIADKKSHNVIMEYLRDSGLPVLSEEGRNIPYDERSKWNWFWLVDPLDGTKEFIKRNGEFTVKKIKIENKSISLIPQNPKYSIINVSKDDDFMFWGVVTFVIKAIKT